MPVPVSVASKIRVAVLHFCARGLSAEGVLPAGTGPDGVAREARGCGRAAWCEANRVEAGDGLSLSDGREMARESIVGRGGG